MANSTINPKPVEMVRSIRVEIGQDKVAIMFGKEIERTAALIRVREIFEAMAR